MLTLFECGPTRGLRCRWLLQEMEVPFEGRHVDLKKGEHLKPDYLAINPFGKLPSLRDGDFVLTESVAICNYLADKFPEKKMIPQAGTRARALYDKWVLFAVTEMEAHLWSIEKNDWLYPEAKRSSLAIESSKEDFCKGAGVLEAHMQGRDFILDQGFTAADVIIGYLLTWATHRQLLGSFANLAKYRDQLTSRSAFPKSAVG